MIDEWTPDRKGWARFSTDKLRRYRLARPLTVRGAEHALDLGEWLTRCSCDDCARDFREGRSAIQRVVFVLLNPSTANAFKPDNTVTRCVKFAQRWGGDVVEVVNLFAFRSPYPRDLRTALDRGDGAENDEQILAACRGASRVVAAWGTGGNLWGRAEAVRALLAQARIELVHLGLSDDGHPKHPLARGKHWIPYEQELQVWT